jgi:TatD DNase family protein
MIDTHCHLDAPEFEGLQHNIITQAWQTGVKQIVVPAVLAHHADNLVALAASYPGVCFALGVHPMFVEPLQSRGLAALESALRSAVELHRSNPALVAVGEIGLDGFVGPISHWQLQVFECQLKVARDFDLPVILHVRKAVDPVLARLRRFGIQSGIAHAFNGSFQQAGACLDQGLALGFGGASTFTRALQIRRLASQLPDDALVLETDAPDIAPAWLHGEHNTPAQVVGIAGALAQLRGVSLAAIEQISTTNAYRVLPRLSQAPQHQPSS